MARRIRFIPAEGALVEVTTRTIQGRHLLTPGPAVNEAALGVLGRAQRLHSVPCCGVCVLSSHYHLLIRVDDAEQMADFMEYVNSNLAREIGRLVDWRGPFWERRYQAIVISDETAAQVDRLRYILENGVKEGLVASPLDWPGIHMARALLEDKPLKGYWFNRTREFQARCSRKEYSRLEFAEERRWCSPNCLAGRISLTASIETGLGSLLARSRRPPQPTGRKDRSSRSVRQR